MKVAHGHLNVFITFATENEMKLSSHDERSTIPDSGDW